jgi:hypothetical protein
MAGVALGLVAGLAATLLAWVFGAGTEPVVGLLAATSAAAAVAWWTAVPDGLAAAAVCWACYDGFVVHRFGELGFGGDDIAALLIMLGVAVLSWLLATHLRARHHPRAQVPLSPARSAPIR